MYILKRVPCMNVQNKWLLLLKKKLQLFTVYLFIIPFSMLRVLVPCVLIVMGGPVVWSVSCEYIPGSIPGNAVDIFLLGQK